MSLTSKYNQKCHRNCIDVKYIKGHSNCFDVKCIIKGYSIVESDGCL